ncbi:MAG TPA: AraC family transcriptional regulator [Ramlibacter sp.]|nr:AraC family transcriptional regulator [Ramlibacter sp.]
MRPAILPRYHGDFLAWTGGAALIGEGSGAIALHSHYAIQLSLGSPSGLRVRFGRAGEWQSCAAALVPSRAVHSIDVNECDWSSVLFIEPETAAGRAIAARLQGRLEVLPQPRIAPFVQRLERAWRLERRPDAVQAVYQGLLRELSGAEQREASDPRVRAAVDHIGRHVDQPLTLPQVAAVAHLSPSRFRHLFVQETGMPLRTYLLWRRLLHVWTLLVQGESLAAAAHAAGFADSAHLSRTSRTMFGLAPSALQMTGPLSVGARLRKPHFA